MRQRDPNGIEAGRVILLNGTPSAGKTTIARALWEELEPPHWYRSIDDFRQGYRGRLDGPRPTWNQLVRGFIRSVAEMAWAGNHVITESVIIPRWLDTYLDALDGLTVVLVGVRCPLHIAEQRERERSDRPKGPIDLAVPDFDAVHTDVPYDVDFDTSVVSVPDAVALIRARLRSPEPTTGFGVLRRRGGTQ
jgi:chloramphenicol 3-O phosphotransferase